MVVLSLFSKLNKIVAPFLLRHGLSLRYRLGGGVIRDNPTLDALLLLPLFQKLISQEVLKEALAKPSNFDEFSIRTFDRIFGPDKNRPDANQSINPRVAILERYLRPVLVPNETWSDVTRWMFHSRFVKFARTEYLLARYGLDLRAAMVKYPKLRQGPQVNIGGSLRQLLEGEPVKGEFQSVTLPSSTTVVSAFNMASWKRNKDSDAIWNRMTDLTTQLGGEIIIVPGTSLRFPALPQDTDMTNLSVEDVLELAGGHVASCGAFNVLCEECDIYQFWSQEYIEGLANYLLERCSSKTVILDVGAGDGILSQLLREHLSERSSGGSPKIIAIDDGSWNVRKRSNVQRMTAAEAVKKYAPANHVIVLCSWMPMGVDWTAAFRRNGVAEYILIGESHDGNCGDNWETWGNPEFRRDDDSREIPPYELDGYEPFHLWNLSPYSFSRFDSSDSSNSATVAFRKIERSPSRGSPLPKSSKRS